MTWTGWVPVLIAVIAAIPGSRALLTIRTDRAMGIRTADREDRAQVATASEGLIDRLMAHNSALEAALATEQEYNRLLLAHVWAGLPPPPPPRPQTTTPT